MEALNSLISHFSHHPMHLFALLFVMALSKSTVIISSFLPPASVMLIGTLTLNPSTLHPGFMWLAVVLGATVGSVVNFHAGQLMGHTRLVGYLTSKHANKVERVQNGLLNNGAVVLFTARFLAVLRYMVPLVAGIVKMNPVKVYLVSLISAWVWAALYVGAALGFSIFQTLSF